jgi:hypothetical protein
MNDNDIRDLFREMREERVPADSLARVRLNVAHRVQRAAGWRIAAWVAACLVMAVAAFLMQSGSLVRHVARSTVAAGPQQPEAPLPLLPPRPAIRPAIRRLHARPAPMVQTVSIRIETPDPDVVILLVGE